MSQPNQYDADGWRYGVRFGGDGSIMHCWSGPTQRARAEEQIAAIGDTPRHLYRGPS